MVASVIELIASGLERFGLHPIHAVAVALGLLVSWGLTQTLKRHWGLSGRPAARLAFMIGVLATYLVARTTPWAMEGYAWLDFWLAVVVGLTAPTFYKLVVIVARHRWPALAEALSGDRKEPTE